MKAHVKAVKVEVTRLWPAMNMNMHDE